MSEANVERIRWAYEAFSRSDLDTARKVAHPEAVLFRPGGQSPLSGAAFRAGMEPDAIAKQRIEPREFRLNGDEVLVRHAEP